MDNLLIYICIAVMVATIIGIIVYFCIPSTEHKNSSGNESDELKLMLRQLRRRPKGPEFIQRYIPFIDEYLQPYEALIEGFMPFTTSCDDFIDAVYKDIKSNSGLEQESPLLYHCIEDIYDIYIKGKVVNKLNAAGLIFLMAWDICTPATFLGLNMFSSATQLQEQYAREMLIAIFISERN